ncbi:sprT domain-containing protein, partial [Salmonella enterica]|nr:sprT domain-containing protein [Salmonella enterica]
MWIAAKPYNCIVQYNSYGDSVMSDIKPAIKAYSELQQAYDWFNP